MANLQDFLQSISNTAAENVSGPVDGINWLLGKAGLPIEDTPLLGSRWMEQKGLTRPVKQSASSLAGETVGLVSPMMVAANAGKIAGGLLQAGDVVRGGLLRASGNISAPRKLSREAGVIKIKFQHDPKEFGDRVVINDDGTATIFKKQSGFKSNADYQDEVFAAAKEKFGTKYDHYFRFTNNQDEIALAKAGKLRNSRNHAEGFTEKGLSVADGPHYGVQGYKYGYPLRGRHLGYGSDGEHLLEPTSVKVLSENLLPAHEIVKADKLKQVELLKKAGLPADYFDGFQFLNNRHTFE